MNMVSTSHLEEEDEEMIQSDTDPWIKHLNTLWDIRFEQRELPTEDKVVQINLGSEANPKPIFISESLSPFEKGNDVGYPIRVLLFPNKTKVHKFLTSNSITSMISGRNRHCCCLTGFTSGLMLR